MRHSFSALVVWNQVASALQGPKVMWPPVAVDAAAVWKDGDAGPLGRGLDAWCEAQFRAALVREVGGEDTYAPGFSGIVDMAGELARSNPPEETTRAAHRVLRSLFPGWLLAWFKVLFARPMPGFSSKLNALCTFAFGQWLMGRLELERLDEDSAGDGDAQLVRIRRCRFLEEAGCASVCVNACLCPTQQFFNDDMGIPMQIEPDYATLECKFKFGVPPSQANEDAARNVPCFSACPFGGTLRDVPRQNDDQCSAM